jgi:hypothetical protein
MRIHLPFLCSIALLFIALPGFGQCGYSPTIHTNKDYCVGSSVKSVTGIQSLATALLEGNEVFVGQIFLSSGKLDS